MIWAEGDEANRNEMEERRDFTALEENSIDCVGPEVAALFSSRLSRKVAGKLPYSEFGKRRQLR